MWSISKIFFTLYFIIFCVVSKILFINIYDKAGYVVDELFHIPQGLNYCEFNFTKWNPKITTLPGLYLVSTALMAPLGFCTMYGMRLTNLLAAFTNVLLFVSLFHVEIDGSKKISWAAILSGISMGIFPPLYFFSHLYYTDTISVTTILLMYYLSKKEHHIAASIIGAFSIIVRQTNVIWVAMIYGQNVIKSFVHITSNKRKKRDRKVIDYLVLKESVQHFLKSGVNLNRLTFENYKMLFSYLWVLGAFALFIFLNGGIVVGDKTAHEVAIHIPQIFYFSLFCTIFAFPHFCLEIIPFIKFSYSNKLFILGAIATCASIVHYNTLVHPYLLADNRHYTFYVWKRVYERCFYAKYGLVLLYIFAIYAGLKRAQPNKHFVYLLIYAPSVILVLILQKLLDVRYFFIPFILLRLKFSTKNIAILLIEYFLYLFINYITFTIFFTKEIKWKDFEETQRIIW